VNRLLNDDGKSTLSVETLDGFVHNNFERPDERQIQRMWNALKDVLVIVPQTNWAASVNYSPLRYPGGKQVLSRVLTRIIELNGATGGTYIEPYAGGAGAALALLFEEHVDRIVINDADYRIYAFWRAALSQTDAFVDRIRTVRLTVGEWRRQREIFQRGRRESILRLGFATFYLNRCNRSGIIASDGPIGGLDQRGKWKIDARLIVPSSPPGSGGLLPTATGSRSRTLTPWRVFVRR
jgi:D12 class N6 adenine-specific DNA methyltransferase